MKYKTIKQKIADLISLPQFKLPVGLKSAFYERVLRGVKIHLGASSIKRFPLHAAVLVV